MGQSMGIPKPWSMPVRMLTRQGHSYLQHAPMIIHEIRRLMLFRGAKTTVPLLFPRVFIQRECDVPARSEKKLGPGVWIQMRDADRRVLRSTWIRGESEQAYPGDWVRWNWMCQTTTSLNAVDIAQKAGPAGSPFYSVVHRSPVIHMYMNK